MELKNVISEELVFFLDVQDTEELFESIATRLQGKGIVKSSYLPALKQREKEFPTGLATELFGVALPHTDAEHVNEEAISIGVLKQPVTFRHMGMGAQEVEVKLVFMLALQKPENQLEVLQTVTSLIQNKAFMEAVTKCASEKEVIDTVLNYAEVSVSNNK
ncbi:PTS sugar transporter subunit IIA [Paucisalibacillus sp. EB02]|uniref:PTS sugar transporter subunit IIA n=1 Tax=Paucisalibacillus sp. EB02 TaxID=1347087 RepID=UPI0004BA8EE9|nr:PTS sugar transporter subunit IIA [Paucisalibacillus sp. EB02]